MSALQSLLLADTAGLRGRYPEQFRVVTPGRLRACALITGALLLLGVGFWRMDIVPARLFSGFGQLVHFLGLMLPPDPGSWKRAGMIVHGLLETLAIAFLGTVLAALIALPLAFLAARNTTLHAILRFLSRRMLDSIRGVDALIWALVWISIVGLGPFAGVLAIMTSDIGTFGKMFSEAIEAVDRRAEEGVAASGGNHLHRVSLGILPQVLPVIIGQILYLLESNTRSSTIIGIVGAGGIGLYLAEMIRTLEWQTVSFIVLLILILVSVIDMLSTRLRAAIAGHAKDHS